MDEPPVTSPAPPPVEGGASPAPVAPAPSGADAGAPSPPSASDTEAAPTAPASEPSTGDGAPASAPAPAPEPAAERDKQGRFRSSQERIAELTRQRHESDREAAYWRGVAQGPAAPAAPEGKPTPDKFSDYGDYVEALAEYKAKEIVSKTRAEIEQSQRAKETAANWQQREAAFRQSTSDYAEVIQAAADLPITQALGTALQESDIGPQLAYHMAKNPEVAERLNGLPERQMLRELGRLEASLTTSSPPAPARVSSAPPPIKPVGQSAAGVPDMAKMPMDEYIKLRKAQGAGWAR